MIELEHVGIAVREVEPVLRILENLIGERPYKMETVAADKIRTHFVRGGGAKLELLESLDPASPVARFVEKHGEGLHHLAFEVDDVEFAYRRLRSIGYQPLDDAPRPGADGKRIFFLHPKDTAGVLFEFCQTVRPALGPAETQGGFLFRRAGRSDGPPVLMLSAEGAPDPLVRGLEQRFSVLAVEWRDDADPAGLLDVLEDQSVHLIGLGSAAPAALALADEAVLNVATLTLYHPFEFDTGRTPAIPTLLIGSDRRYLDATIRLAKRLPDARLAVFPDDEPGMAARLIERHAART